MCNLSDGVYLEGVEKGLAEGKAAGLAEGKASGKLELIKSSLDKFGSFDECMKFFNITDEDEIKFLKRNIKIQ